MGDVGEMFKDMNEQGKKKRASNREKSAQLLVDNNIVFSEHNMGAHLVVEGKNGYIDFWPGTGRWTVRTPPRKTSFGVMRLIDYIKNS